MCVGVCVCVCVGGVCDVGGGRERNVCKGEECGVCNI